MLPQRYSQGSNLMLRSVYQQLARESLIFCFQVNAGIPSQSRGGQLKLLEDRMCCFEVTAKQDHRLEESVVVKCRLSQGNAFSFVQCFLSHTRPQQLYLFRKPASATTYRDACAQVSDKRFCLYNPLGVRELNHGSPRDLRVEAEEGVEHGTCNTT